MIQVSVKQLITYIKTLFPKWSATSTGLKMRKKKSAKVKRKTLKDLQEAWRTSAQNHSKRLQENLAHWKQNIKK